MALDFNTLSDTKAVFVRTRDTATGDDKDTHVANLTMSNPLNPERLNPALGILLQSTLKRVIETGRPSPIGVGMVSYYHKSGNTLSLRFIDPDKPKLSEPLAVIEIKDESLFTDKTLKNFMASLTVPDDQKLRFHPAEPKLPRA